VVQTLYTKGGGVYQHDNASIHTARLLTEWFDAHESEDHFPWPAQSPDQKIKPLWSILEEQNVFLYQYPIVTRKRIIFVSTFVLNNSTYYRLLY